MRLIWTIFPAGLMILFTFTFTPVLLSCALVCYINSTNVSILYLPTLSNTVWNTLNIDFVSILFYSICSIALKPKIILFNFCTETRNGTLTSAIFLSRSAFTDTFTHPKKEMFSSSPNCTLSESHLSRKELTFYIRTLGKLDPSLSLFMMETSVSIIYNRHI